MHPEPGEGSPTMGADTLGNLVLVVRKDQIEAAAMDVESLAEMHLAHRRALDVPAWAAAPPGALPARQVRVRRLPQHEVGGIALVGRHLDASAGNHLLAVAAGKLPVMRIGADGEQDMA